MPWLSSPEALARLKVKPQTLYAYVSRGLITAKPAPHDPRQSLYAEQDIAAILRRRKGGRAQVAKRAIAWGDPVLETAITTVRDGRLIYRGRDAVALSETATLEDAARLLWGQPELDFAAPCGPIERGETAKARGYAYLARAAAHTPPAFSRAPASLATEGAALLSGLACAFAGGEGLFHERLAATWGVGPRGADLIRRALVLVADHELNPSTFAARVAASTGAPLAAAALAGYAALSGPLHGEASARAVAYLEDAARIGAAAAADQLLARAESPPGVGHPLYPHGDPRAAALLKALKPKGALAAAIDAAERAAGETANIDMALAALTVACRLPREAPFVIFTAGRMAGWIAHAMEQIASRRPIRPRAAYTGA